MGGVTKFKFCEFQAEADFASDYTNLKFFFFKRDNSHLYRSRVWMLFCSFFAFYGANDQRDRSLLSTLLSDYGWVYFKVSKLLLFEISKGI